MYKVEGKQNIRKLFLLSVAFSLLQSPSFAKGYLEYNKAGDEAYRAGNSAEAEKNILSSLKEAEKAGPNNLRVAEALNNLGVIYDEAKRYSEAETCYIRALSIREKSLGPLHMDVATTLNNMANLYKDQEKYKEAVPLYKRSIDICLEKEGSNSEFLAMSYYNLANLFMLQARYNDAIPLLKRALQLLENGSDPEDRSMDVVGKLGMAYDKLGKVKEAKPYFMRYYAIAAKTMRLDPDAPKTAEILKAFAANMRKQNNLHVAEPTEKALEYRLKPKD